jgi:hypothetical protein
MARANSSPTGAIAAGVLSSGFEVSESRPLFECLSLRLLLLVLLYCELQ